MNVVQNYNMTNCQLRDNKTAFKANISEPLKKDLLKELNQDVGNIYLSRLTKKFSYIPMNVTVQDIINRGGRSHVTLKYKNILRTYPLSSEGSKLEIVESLLKKPRREASLLSRISNLLFGISH